MYNRYMRDFPVSFDMILENLADPGHVHFAHHGVISKRSNAKPLDYKDDTKNLQQAGLRMVLNEDPDKRRDPLEFRAPCSIRCVIGK